jgi:MFS transporter, DHA1 family, solute carrier family 18 (vesicular amine transporter), member 1/2
LFLARTLQGAVAAIPWTAGLTIIAEQYSGMERYRRFTQVFSATSIGTLVGPSLGGILYTWRGFQAPFLFVAALTVIDAALTLVVFASMARARKVQLRNSSSRTVAKPALSGSRTTTVQLAYRRVATALLITSAGALLLALLDPTLPVLLSERYGLVPLTIGLVFGAMTILFILVQTVVAALLKKYSSGTALFFGLTIGPLALILVAVSATLVHVLVALGILAFSFAFLLTPALELLTQTAQQAVAQAKRVGVLSRSRSARPKSNAEKEALPYGRLYASYNLAYSVGMLIGPILAGVAVTVLGWTLGLALTGFALFFLYLPLSLRMFFGSPSVSPPPRLQEPASRIEIIEIMEILEAIELVQIVETEEIIEIEEIEMALVPADEGINERR